MSKTICSDFLRDCLLFINRLQAIGMKGYEEDLLFNYLFQRIFFVWSETAVNREVGRVYFLFLRVIM